MIKPSITQFLEVVQRCAKDMPRAPYQLLDQQRPPGGAVVAFLWKLIGDFDAPNACRFTITPATAERRQLLGWL